MGKGDGLTGILFVQQSLDEFQNFSTESFASILSEARKYRLNLTVAHQYLSQLSEIVKRAIFGNIGTVIAFRSGSFDAKELAEEMKPIFTGSDVELLENHHILLRLMIDGKTSQAFSAVTLPPIDKNGEEAEKKTIVRVSRERFTIPRDIIEEKIHNWFGK